MSAGPGTAQRPRQRIDDRPTSRAGPDRLSSTTTLLRMMHSTLSTLVMLVLFMLLQGVFIHSRE